MTRLAAGLALAVAALATEARADDAVEAVERAEREVEALDARLKFVAREYISRGDIGEGARLKKRFQDAEIQFLLEDFQRASFLLYDVAENETFKKDPSYPTALYYLGESLYQQKNYLAARPFLRQALTFGTRHQQESLLRLVQISDVVGDSSGIEDYMQQLQASGARIRPEVQYVYAKWQHRRADLPDSLRISRAQEAFRALGMNNPYGMQSLYFLGTLSIEATDLVTAEKFFAGIGQMGAKTKEQKQIAELAALAMGRIAYEQNRIGDAIDRYQEIPRDSRYYNDALFEISWCFVKKGEFEKALQATELLLLVAKETLLEPEARVLQGDLLTRLGRYKEALAIYDEVVETYEPAEQQLGELLARHDDAVKFFDTLIRQGSGALELKNLIPDNALRWATSQKEIAESVKILGDLDAGKKGVQEALELVRRLNETVSSSSIEIFPTLQEGISRAVEVENSLIRLRQNLLAVEIELYSGPIPHAVLAEILARRKEREALEALFKASPQTAADLEARKSKTTEAYTGLQKQAYRASYEAQQLVALTAAMEKYQNDTRESRSSSAIFDPKEERDLMARLRQEKAIAQQLLEERTDLARQIDIEAARVAAGEGLTTRADQELRMKYGEALEKERAALERARPSLPAGSRALADRVENLRGKVALLEANVGSVRDQLRQAAARRSGEFKARVALEQAALESYAAQVARAEGDTSTLVGEITFGSFQKVKGQIHDLVLKADVGLVDVSWAKKREKSDKISSLAKNRDDDLKLLEDDFREVLKEED